MPENNDTGMPSSNMDKEPELTTEQKKARTRAANKAKKELDKALETCFEDRYDANGVRKNPAESYHWVTFAPKGENEPEQIILGIDGKILICRRQVQVILPLSYVILAKNTTSEFEEIQPDGSKEYIRRATFPMAYIKRATPAEYRKQCQEGLASSTEQARKMNTTMKAR